MEGTRQIGILALLTLMLVLTGCTGFNQLNKDSSNGPTEKSNSTDVDDTTKTENTAGADEGYSKTGVWSPDRKWVAVTYTARENIDTHILEVGNNKEYDTYIFQYITMNAEKYSYRIGENQKPKPFINFLEWSPDSSRVLLSYSFFDDSAIRQMGVTVFNLEKMTVEWMMKLAPQEDADTDVKKPDDFDWESPGYGLDIPGVRYDYKRGDSAP